MNLVERGADRSCREGELRHNHRTLAAALMEVGRKCRDRLDHGLRSRTKRSAQDLSPPPSGKRLNDTRGGCERATSAPDRPGEPDAGRPTPWRVFSATRIRFYRTLGTGRVAWSGWLTAVTASRSRGPRFRNRALRTCRCHRGAGRPGPRWANPIRRGSTVRRDAECAKQTYSTSCLTTSRILCSRRCNSPPSGRNVCQYNTADKAANATAVAKLTAGACRPNRAASSPAAVGRNAGKITSGKRRWVPKPTVA